MTEGTQMNDPAMMSAKGLLLTSLLILAGNALAQQGTIQLEHKAEQWESVTDAEGIEQTRLVEAARVLPGEEVLFSVTYTNVGDQAAEDVTITNPVPDHMSYVDNSATGDNTSVTFSVDGGETFGAAQDLLVTDALGAERPALAKDYTHIRWVVDSDVSAGASGTVRFTAVVE
ncbi:MAG: hypothetical protein OEM85_13065 [Gammaproteobacteria bacterium]|nr:hypothetical protein [Gammaproteobacteria bacterium]